MDTIALTQGVYQSAGARAPIGPEGYSMTALSPTTLRALLIRMHDVIWGPWVNPIDRQNEQLEWLSRLSAHIKAWEAEREGQNEHKDT